VSSQKAVLRYNLYSQFQRLQ